jgi:hypothetical protein
MAVTISELPAPEEDPESWNLLYVDNQLVPGQCLLIDATRERDTEHKKSKGSSRDILIDQGLKPSDCTVKIRTFNGTELRDLQRIYLEKMDPNRPLNKLNVSTVAHPQMYALGIKQGYFYSSDPPTPTAAGGIHSLVRTLKFKIVGPKTQIQAASASSKPKLQTKIGGDIAAPFQLNGGVTTIQPAGQPVPTATPARPADQPPLLFTPAQIQKSADSGSPSARFANALIQGASPR